MIGIVMLGSNDVTRARSFYDPLMSLCGATLHPKWSTADRIWYVSSQSAPMLAISKPYDSKPASIGNGSMVGLAVHSKDAVKTMHAKAIELGGVDEGAPGNRSADPDDLYRAYFRDLDGNKIMVFAMAQSAD